MRPSDDQPTLSLPSVDADLDPAPEPDAGAALGEWFAADPDEAAQRTATTAAEGPSAEREAVLQAGEELLSATPSNVSPDELDQALATPPPSARSLRLTKILGVSLVVAIGFAGGVYCGQQTAQPDQAALPGGFARGSVQLSGGFPGRPGTTGDGASGSATDAGGAPAAGNSGSDDPSSTSSSSATTTEGTVKLVDGSVIYVTDSAGNLTRVAVDKDTDVVTTQKTELEDIATGDKVTVTGTTGTDGVAADTVAVAE